jgi:hypothetical protein
MMACATSSTPSLTAQDATSPRGPWAEVPALEMPTGDASIPIDLLRDVADALLKLPGAKVCDPVSRKPIVGLSTECWRSLRSAEIGSSVARRPPGPGQRRGERGRLWGGAKAQLF